VITCIPHNSNLIFSTSKNAFVSFVSSRISPYKKFFFHFQQLHFREAQNVVKIVPDLLRAWRKRKFW